MLYWVRYEIKVKLSAGKQGTWSEFEFEICWKYTRAAISRSVK